MGAAIITVVLVGTLSAIPPVGGAAADQSNAPTKPAERPPATPVPTHALSGVVKFVDSTRLVITRAGKNPGEMTFVLSLTTHREGPISVGATIQVRFRTEGHTRVATAILASPPKHPGTKAPEPLIHFSRATSPESADT